MRVCRHCAHSRIAPVWLLAAADGEGPASSSMQDGLWADFGVEEPASDAPPLTVEESRFDDDWADDADGDWDEPTGPEEPPDGVAVESVANYLPLLMQRKYGDDWELLLADAEPLRGEGAADGAKAGYVDEVAHGADEDGDDEAGSEELRRLVREQQAAAGDEEDEDGDALAAARATQSEQDDFAQLVDSLRTEPAKAASLSPLLAEFVAGMRDGTVQPPAPFPASEWSHVYVTAITEHSRYVELSNTWANLVRPTHPATGGADGSRGTPRRQPCRTASPPHRRTAAPPARPAAPPACFICCLLHPLPPNACRTDRLPHRRALPPDTARVRRRRCRSACASPRTLAT
jgi:hypothetical protein